MFREFLPHIGTKNYNYQKFNNKLLSCTDGVKVQIDTYSDASDFEDIFARKENLLISSGFLDRNIDKAFECLTELLATPNFDEPSNIADLIKMESISKANNIGNRGLEYARSYAASGLKAHARSFESLRRDIFFCQYAAEVLKTTQPKPMLQNAIQQMTEIASHLFRQQNLEIAIHGNSSKFPLIEMKLEMLLNSLSQNNSEYKRSQSKVELLEDFTKPLYYQNFFKTPLSVNMCAESLLAPTIAQEDEYASMLILQEVLTYVHLHPLIREKGGAYGGGCSVSDSGIFSFYSYRDPNCDSTFTNFERAC